MCGCEGGWIMKGGWNKLLTSSQYPFSQLQTHFYLVFTDHVPDTLQYTSSFYYILDDVVIHNNFYACISYTKLLCCWVSSARSLMVISKILIGLIFLDHLECLTGRYFKRWIMGEFFHIWVTSKYNEKPKLEYLFSLPKKLNYAIFVSNQAIISIHIIGEKL